ncbi:MAG TPA: hypothetical protein VGD62_00920 [Acidobacteriaceae bacterium]
MSPTPTPRGNLFARLLSYPCLLTALAATWVCLLVPRSADDPDIWWHLRNAQAQLAAHAFLRCDSYSFTAKGAPWINHEWLAELPFYLGWRLLGTRGLFLVTLAAVECIFLGVFYLARRQSGRIQRALLATVVAAFLSTVSFGPRTLLFGWVALVAELILLDHLLADDRRPATRPTAVWLLPLLFGAWVNTHGSWLIGLVLLLTSVACAWLPLPAGTRGVIDPRNRRRDLTLATALSVAALFVNPYGWRLVLYPFNLAFHQRLNIANIEEWRTLDFHSVRAHVLLLTLALLFLAQLRRPRRWAPRELAFLFIAVYAAFTYARFLFLAAILLAPILARHIPGLPTSQRHRPGRNQPWLNAALLCLLATLAVRHFPSPAEPAPAAHPAFPDTALPFLTHWQPHGPLLNEYLWGGYLEWHARQVPIFVDSRVDIFEYSGVFADYLAATRLQNTLAILDKYRIRYVLFAPDAPLVYLLQHTGGWTTLYHDPSAVLLERGSSAPRPATRPANP